MLSDRYKALGEQVLVIESNGNNAMIGHCKDRGATVLIGSATDPQLLKKARVNQAKCVIAVCDKTGRTQRLPYMFVNLLRDGETSAIVSCSHS